MRSSSAMTNMSVDRVEMISKILMGYHPGHLQFIAETLDSLLVNREIGPDELEGDFCFDLLIFNPIDLAHPPLAELFDHFLAAGKKRPPGEFVGPRFKGLGERRAFARAWEISRCEEVQLRSALPAEFQGIGILRLSFRTFDGHSWPPSRNETRLARNGILVKGNQSRSDNAKFFRPIE